MDPQVWKHLPDHEELLQFVLYRVPWDDKLHFRSVSKSWNDMLSKPPFLTWSSMLTHGSFYADHPDGQWMEFNFTTNAAFPKPEHVCLFSISPGAYAVLNLKIGEWCKLPPMGNLSSRQWDNFTVTGVAGGLLLLEGNVNIPYRKVDLYKLDRFLVNPTTMDFMRLPPVPFNPDSTVGLLRYPMIMTVHEDETIRVVAIEYSPEGHQSEIENFSTEDPIKFSPRDMITERISRILIWQHSSDGWKTLEIDETRFRFFQALTVQNVVFAHDKIFFHTRYWSIYNAEEIQTNEMNTCERDSWLFHNYDHNPVTHIFQHRGFLKRLTGLWEGHQMGLRAEFMKLETLDPENGKWMEKKDMPWPMQRKVWNSFRNGGVRCCSITVQGDILSIGNRFKVDVLFLYNLVTHAWTEILVETPTSEVYARLGIDSQNKNNREIFLWSPKQGVNF